MPGPGTRQTLELDLGTIQLERQSISIDAPVIDTPLAIPLANNSERLDPTLKNNVRRETKLEGQTNLSIMPADINKYTHV